MPNLSLKKTPMRNQDPILRGKNFDEVSLGYSAEEAAVEADRCLNCKNPPCVGGCPVNINIPAFIQKIKSGENEAAYGIISLSSSLPAVCGRVCPQESQCEKYCVRAKKGEAVAIGRLERFAADTHAKCGALTEKSTPTGKKVAVVGSGPSGLACAGDLAKKGYRVTVFEALHVAGGVLMYGIPEFRLPKSIVANEIEALQNLGVEIIRNVVIGKSLTVDELFDDGYEAVFVGSGAGLPNFMGIEGETLNGVYSANEYLTRANLMQAYKEHSSTPIQKGGNVIVVGGGNVAMDAARTALRLGADSVTVVYRRSLDELPARKEEVEHAIEEGVTFNLLSNPTRILSDSNGFVGSVECVKMQLGEPDERGRRSPVVIKGSEYCIPADTVIIAIGTSPNPLIKSTTQGLSVNRRGGIIIDEETCMTSRSGVFAGGDAVTGSATVISAMGAGKRAAKAIDEYLQP